MTAHPDAKLLDLGRQFHAALAQARKIKNTKERYDEINRHISVAVRLMRAIYRERATTLEGFAVKLAAVTFYQFDFDPSASAKGRDVAERQLWRLNREMQRVAGGVS